MDPEVLKITNLFFNKYKHVHLKSKDMVINPENEPSGLYFLKEGVVRQFAITASGDEVTLNIFKAPSFFPISWILNNTLGEYYFECVSDASIFIAPKKESLEFLANNNSVLLDLIKRIYRGLDGYMMKMEGLMTGSAKSRLVAEILIYARRFGENHGSKIKVNLKITEAELASQLGITRETVSREVQKLKEKKLISFNKKTLLINNLDKLEQEIINNTK